MAGASFVFHGGMSNAVPPRPDDSDPIANTEMFQRFVDDDPRPAGARPAGAAPVAPTRSKLITVGAPILAVLVIALIIFLLTR